MQTNGNPNTQQAETATVLSLHSTADLNNLPERLTDQQLAMVEAIGEAPLPTLPPCDDRHFNKCLRLMLAVLPKQKTDELGGELFVEAYRRQLGKYPNEAMSYLTDRVTATCKWFPTIAECLEILGGWKRRDDAVIRKAKARNIVMREFDARRSDEIEKMKSEPLTQEQVDGLPGSLRIIGLRLGYLERGKDGKIRPAVGD